MLQKQGMYRAEHVLAWIFVVGAIILAVVGALVAFDVITLRTVVFETPLLEVQVSGTAEQNFRDAAILILPAIALGILAWTMHSSEHHVGGHESGATATAGSRTESAGMSSGSMGDRARSAMDTAAGAGQDAARTGAAAGREAMEGFQPSGGQGRSGGSALGTTEHWLAYAGMIFTLVLGTIAIIVGFNVFDDGYSYRDGIIWGLLAITAGAITATLHSVQHHAMPAVDVDDIRVMVEERVGRLERQGTMAGAGGMATAAAGAGAGAGMAGGRDMPGGAPGGMPGGQTGTPGTQAGMPGQERDVPGAPGGMPGGQAGTPGTQGSMPGQERDIPGAPGTMSSAQGGLPGSQNDLPGAGRDMPETPRPPTDVPDTPDVPGTGRTEDRDIERPL
jgi:hypothetical protein